MRFVVVLEKCDGALRRRDAQPQPQQRLVRGIEAGRKRLAEDGLHAQVAQPEVVDAASARARIERGRLPHERGGLDRRLHVVDRQHEQFRFSRLGRVQELDARGVAVIHLVAESPHEVDLLVAHVERREFTPHICSTRETIWPKRP